MSQPENCTPSPDDWLVLASWVKSTVDFASHYFVDITILLNSKRYISFSFSSNNTFWQLLLKFISVNFHCRNLLLYSSKIQIGRIFVFLVNEFIRLGPWLMCSHLPCSRFCLLCIQEYITFLLSSHLRKKGNLFTHNTILIYRTNTHLEDHPN